MLHFKGKEFFCPCTECSLNFDDMDEDFIRDLDLARGYAHVPFHLTSSIRCAKHNLRPETGGTKTSSHLKGLAVDIACPSSYYRYRIIYGLRRAGFDRIGIGNNFIHVDKDMDKPRELMWTY